MAISPPSDLIVDVMRAADPRQSAAATARLQALAAGRATSATPGTGAAWQEAWQQAQQAGTAAMAAKRTAAGTMPTEVAAAGPVRLGKAPDARELKPDGTFRQATTSAAHMTMKTRATEEQARLRQAYAGLEGVLVANMLEGMLGTGGNGRAGSLFGSGLAASYWKSLLAQSVAEQIARAGGLGMADALSSRAQPHLASPLMMAAEGMTTSSAAAAAAGGSINGRGAAS